MSTIKAETERDKRTPFSKVEFRENTPYVEFQENWVKLLSIEGKAVDKYIQAAKTIDPSDWKFRFTRHLHYIMDDMKMERGKSVKVSFEQNGKVVTHDYELKKENRNLATDYYEECIGRNKIRREHNQTIPAEYDYLTVRMDSHEKTDKNWISREEAIHDLEHLEWQIVNNYSYAELTGFNYPLALDAIRANLKKGITRRDFALQLKMFMANFGDGHSRVSMKYLFTDKSEILFLPFNITKVGNIFSAINPEKKELWNKQYPQLVAINGIDIQTLYQLAERMVPKTTSKFVERNTTDYLSYTAWILKLAGVDVKEKVSVRFSNGTKSIQEEFKLKNKAPKACIKREYLKSEILDGKLAYLAFQEHMDRDKKFIAALHKAMKEFKGTHGLIIDIRGNGGGNRAPLKALLPYFIKTPKIANIARYRINSDKDSKPKYGYLPARYAYYEDYEAYTKAERKSIQNFKKSFTPTKEVTSDKFTDYHYMVVSPTNEQGTYYYDKPVIVLVDEGCFSASDIFAAGIRQGDQVRLLGNTTGGGSGFSKSRRLPNSRIKVKLSRIFSYQPDGNLYDGHGVIPDIKVDYTLDDKLGKKDSQLERAKEILSR
ncbi:S41 family peptidase [Ancylomarina sp. DW003]|nr:S41 family peptidase [Ancylomarina sp. DW003]MDE5421836.1 S41 family peptidase [Ancylomarina sp. DW003]